MTVKGALLGAAFVTAAATGAAQAADLPMAPEPVDYVRVCDAYGARFFYIPGTDTCLRVGGRVRVQYVTGNMADDGDFGRAADDYDFLSRGYVYLDARTNTEWGLLRAYTSLYITSATANANDGPALEYGYIQFGGFTFGRATSMFDFFTGGTFMGVVGRDWSDRTQDLVAYTAAFGNGFSATLSLEDANNRQVVSTSTMTPANFDISRTYAGVTMPDVVANLRVDQGWGSAQVMGALHVVRDSVAMTDGQMGFAGGAGVTFNLPMLASGSNITFQAIYANGAMDYTGANFYDYAVNTNTGAVDTTKGYALAVALYHQMTSTVGLALEGTYAGVSLGGLPGNAKRYAIDASAKWEPVSGFEMGLDIGYSSTDYDITGVADDNDFKFGARVQRTF